MKRCPHCHRLAAVPYSWDTRDGVRVRRYRCTFCEATSKSVQMIGEESELATVTAPEDDEEADDDEVNEVG